jgi:hypothetical protein
MLKQIMRGCGMLPHVGEHPGTLLLFIFILMGAAAGVKGGWAGALGGASIMAIVFVPMYLYGAYDRAKLSDELQTEENFGAQVVAQQNGESA